MKCNEFPLVFGKHVVIDTRTGASYYDDSPSSSVALANTVMALGEEEVDKLGARQEIADLLEGELLEVVFGKGKGDAQGSLFDVKKVGPFETTGGSLSAKNMMFVTRRFSAIMNGEMITDEDHEAGRWVAQQYERSVLLKAQEEERRASAEPTEGSMAEFLSKILGGAKIVEI